MKRIIGKKHSWVIIVVAAVFLGGVGFFYNSVGAQIRSKTIETFSRYKVGKFPKSFRTYPFQRRKAKKVYKVVEENGNQFLRAVDEKDISVQVMREFHWDIERYPWITWKWRARTLPKGGDERQAASNDSACGIYIVFGKYTGKALKYVWSDQAPVGTVVNKKPGRFQIIVMQSGPPGQWETVQVDIAKDYQKAFGKPLERNPTGIGILTDGNALHVKSACDYDDFVLYTQAPRPVRRPAPIDPPVGE